MKKRLPALLALTASLLLCAWTWYERTKPAPDASLVQLLQQIEQEEDMKGAALSMYVVSLKTGKVLLDHHGHRSMTPASTLKSITTATALQILGPDYRFVTRLEHDGHITQDGLLEGNLYLHGGGDPSLGLDDHEAVIDEWTNALIQKGIRKINGSIIADADIFEYNPVPGGWVWDDIGNYYGTGAFGLNIHENLYHLYFKPGPVGQPAQVLRTVPPMPELTFFNEMKTGPAGSGDNGYIYGMPYTDYHLLRGTIPAGVSEFGIKGAMPDPPLFCASRLRERLQAKGIASRSANTLRTWTGKPGQRVAFWSKSSEPLSELIRTTNQRSHNLFAEAIFKAIGVRQAKEGSTKASAKALLEYWEKQGVDTKGVFVEDGSGLTRANAVTARFVVQVLQHTARATQGQVFQASLPVVGQDGTVRNLCKGGAAQGRVRAKSGFFARTRGYVGYAEGLKGDQIAFAILANQYAGSYSAMTGRFERLLNALAARY